MPHTCQFLSGFTCFRPKLLEFITTMITSHHCSPRRFLQARCRKWVWSHIGVTTTSHVEPLKAAAAAKACEQRKVNTRFVRCRTGYQLIVFDLLNTFSIFSLVNPPWQGIHCNYVFYGFLWSFGSQMYVKTKSRCRYWWYCVMVLGTAWQKHFHSMPVQRGRRHPSPISPPSHAASNCCHSLAMPCTWRLGDRHCWTFHGCACNARCCFKMLPLLVLTSRVHWPLLFPLVSWCMNSMNSSHSPAPKLQEL